MSTARGGAAAGRHAAAASAPDHASEGSLETKAACGLDRGSTIAAGTVGARLAPSAAACAGRWPDPHPVALAHNAEARGRRRRATAASPPGTAHVHRPRSTVAPAPTQHGRSRHGRRQLRLGAGDARQAAAKPRPGCHGHPHHGRAAPGPRDRVARRGKHEAARAGDRARRADRSRSGALRRAGVSRGPATPGPRCSCRAGHRTGPDTARALAALHLLALGKRPATAAATAWAAQLLLRTPHATGAAISRNRWPGPWMQRRTPAPALAGRALRLVRYRLRRNRWPSPDASL